MSQTAWQKWYQRARPLLMALAFMAHVLVLVMWAGGVFVLFALAAKSSLGVVPRVAMVGVGLFMLWGLWLQLPDFWKGWFGRRRG